MTNALLNSHGRRIDVHDATVKTATVEIKALTISGKQVTLAVFRQLQEELLVDSDTGLLLGVPWGTINYHPGKECEDAGTHLHVVWQKGSELRRSRIEKFCGKVAGWKTRFTRLEKSARWYMAARILEGWRPANAEQHKPSTETSAGCTFPTVHTIYETCGNYTVAMKLTDAMLRLWHPETARTVDPQTGGIRHAYGWHVVSDEDFAAEQEQMRGRVSKISAGHSSEALWKEDVKPALDGLDSFKDVWADTYAQLQLLDQLFIAV